MGFTENATFAIETAGLTKRYGQKRGIEDVSLTVKSSEIFGFLGPNGSGKTTTIRTILGLLVPTAGTAKVLGLDIRMDSLAIRNLDGLLAIYAAIAVAGIISREIDRGTAEFLFGLPVGRIRLVLARFAAFALNVALLHFTVYAAAWAGAARIGEPFPFDASLRVVAMSYLAVLAVSALLLLTSVFIPDYSRALFTGLGISVGLYVFSMALRAAGKEALLPWLIFGRYDAAALVRTGANVVDAAVLAGYTVVLVAAAVWAFSRRDLRL